jgi:hypothetical protein
MTEKQEEKLQTLDELFNYNAKVSKACSMGVIIDATSHYYDEDKGHYIKRLKIIDSSFNMTKPINGLKFGYCTVTIFAKRPDELPEIQSLGDIIYLRRYILNYLDLLSRNTMITSNHILIKKIFVIGFYLMEKVKLKALVIINLQD